MKKKTLTQYGLTQNEIFCLDKEGKKVLKDLEQGVVQNNEKLNDYKKFLEFESMYCK